MTIRSSLAGPLGLASMLLLAPGNVRAWDGWNVYSTGAGRHRVALPTLLPGDGDHLLDLLGRAGPGVTEDWRPVEVTGGQVGTSIQVDDTWHQVVGEVRAEDGGEPVRVADLARRLPAAEG